MKTEYRKEFIRFVKTGIASPEAVMYLINDKSVMEAYFRNVESRNRYIVGRIKNMAEQVRNDLEESEKILRKLLDDLRGLEGVF